MFTFNMQSFFWMLNQQMFLTDNQLQREIERSFHGILVFEWLPGALYAFFSFHTPNDLGVS